MNAEEYINSFAKFGQQGGFKPGLARIRALLEPFGHPERELPVIHVAGSNGKGSTISILKEIYQQAGYRVGVYTSPHLVDFRERFVYNNQYIQEEELQALIDRLRPVVEEVSAKTALGRPSYFELVTALAFLFFSQKKPDLLLLEVGLGGRLDATNVLPFPLLSIITSISLEHTHILGDDLASIAREKAGIIKEKRPVVTGVKSLSALKVIKKIAEERQAPLLVIDEEYAYQSKESSLEGQSFLLSPQGKKAQGTQLEEYKLGLLGEYQIRNALMALSAVQLLAPKYPVSKQDLQAGLKKAKIPGRLELVSLKPTILLDGAHNPEGMENLSNFLQPFANKKEIILLLSILKDKDVEGMLRPLAQLDRLRLVITKNKNPRALEPAKIKEIAAKYNLPAIIYPNLNLALQETIRQAENEQVICITGSLYTVGEVKIILGEKDNQV